MIVPNRKGEHAVQPRQTVLAPLSPGGQQDLGVAFCSERVAFGHQLLA